MVSGKVDTSVNEAEEYIRFVTQHSYIAPSRKRGTAFFNKPDTYKSKIWRPNLIQSLESDQEDSTAYIICMCSVLRMKKASIFTITQLFHIF